jgi:CRISPR-associated protein Csb3
LAHLVGEFVRSDVQQLEADDNAASPLFLGEPFDLRLDWWKKVENKDKSIVDLGGGHQLKPWAARQQGPLIFRVMKNACEGLDLQAPFDDRRTVYDFKDGKAKKKTISPFYFDARRAETSLDIGFSPDEQDMSVNEYPAVESLALVGLQRFRPRVNETNRSRSFLYIAWSEMLTPVVAMAGVAGMIPVRNIGTYRFTRPSRGGEYLTMFSRATRERSTNA